MTPARMPEKRTHHRSPENTQTSVSMNKVVLREARRLAAQEGRTFSNWLEQLLRYVIAEDKKNRKR